MRWQDPYARYGHYGIHGWRGSLVVWVLRTDKGTEYVVGEDAVPRHDQLQYVVARLGPIAYEEGQGLEQFKEQLAKDVETFREDRKKEVEREHMLATIRREVESRMPKPPEPESPDNGPER